MAAKKDQGRARRDNDMPRKPSVLIADDEPGVLLTLQWIFQESGYTVSTAESGAEAIKLIRDHGTFDAVISDLCMEKDQSGLQVAKAAAELRPVL